MQGKSLTGYPFRVEANVSARVVGPNKKVKQNIEKHNMATANLTEGVVKFLRGEFTESYISGLIPNIGNDFNIADQYIPAYMGMGCIGVGKTDEGKLTVSYGSNMAPSYSDTKLLQEVIPLSNPSRAQVAKSVRSNTLLSNASTLLISTAYHFEDPAEAQYFCIEPNTLVKKDDKLYISNTVFPGELQKQRIKSITPITAGWSFSVSTPASAQDDYRECLTLTYTNTDKSHIDVLQLDCNTGIFTALTDYTFPTGLELNYDPVNFDFKFVDDAKNTVPYEQENMVRTYYMTELGLFSGNVSNDSSKLMARVVLDEDTPLVISEGDYVLISWQIGVYALEDALYEEDTSGAVVETDTYKYVTQDEPTTMAWSEITMDADGNIIDGDTVTEMRALYDVQSVEYLPNRDLRLTLKDTSGLFVGQTNVSFTLANNETITGCISVINGPQSEADYTWTQNANGIYIPDGLYRIIDLVCERDEYQNFRGCYLDVEINPNINQGDSQNVSSTARISLLEENHYIALTESILNPYFNIVDSTISETPADNRFVYINSEKVYLYPNMPIDHPMSVELTSLDHSYGSQALKCITDTQVLDFSFGGHCYYSLNDSEDPTKVCYLNDTVSSRFGDSYSSVTIRDITDYSKLDGLGKNSPVADGMSATSSINGLSYESPLYKYAFGLEKPASGAEANAVYYELPSVKDCTNNITKDLEPLRLTYSVVDSSPECCVSYGSLNIREPKLIIHSANEYNVYVALDADRTAMDLDGEPSVTNKRVESHKVQQLIHTDGSDPVPTSETITDLSELNFTHRYNGLYTAAALIKDYLRNIPYATVNDHCGTAEKFKSHLQAVLDACVVSNDTSSGAQDAEVIIKAFEGIIAADLAKNAAGDPAYNVTYNNDTISAFNAVIVLSYKSEAATVNSDTATVNSLAVSFDINYTVGENITITDSTLDDSGEDE